MGNLSLSALVFCEDKGRATFESSYRILIRHREQDRAGFRSSRHRCLLARCPRQSLQLNYAMHVLGVANSSLRTIKWISKTPVSTPVTKKGGPDVV